MVGVAEWDHDFWGVFVIDSDRCGGIYILVGTPILGSYSQFT